MGSLLLTLLLYHNPKNDETETDRFDSFKYHPYIVYPFDLALFKMMKVLALFVSLSVRLLPTLADQLPFEEKTNVSVTVVTVVTTDTQRWWIQNLRINGLYG